MELAFLARLSDCRSDALIPLIRLSPELGVTGVELVHDEPIPQQALACVRDRLRGLDLRVVAVHIPVFRPGSRDDSSRRDFDRAREALQQAVYLGSSLCVFTSKPPPGLLSSPAIQAWFEQRVAPLVTEAVRTGLIPTFNNSGTHAACFGSSNYFKHLCEAFSPHAGMTFDAGNWLLAGENLDSAAARLAPWIRHVHLKDWKRVPESRGVSAQARFHLLRLKRWLAASPLREMARPVARRFQWSRFLKPTFRSIDGVPYEGAILGEGVVDPARFLDRLRADGYRGAVTVEYEGSGDVTEACRRGVDWLRRQLDAPRRAEPDAAPG